MINQDGRGSDERGPDASTHSRVRFVQTGGVAGLKFVAEIDTSAMDTAAAVDWERLVDAALVEYSKSLKGRRSTLNPTAEKAATHASRPLAPTVGSALPSVTNATDAPHYEVIVTRKGKAITLRADDQALGAIGNLVARLQAQSKPSR